MTEFRTLGSLVLVIALLAAVLWLLRRRLGPGRLGGPLTIETALSLGERRSLVIVGIEGRRLLLGVTPTAVSLVTELQSGREFADAIDRHGSATT